ncbi:hypothetical protein [Halobaculum marinum]|uniref:hypothetical protein n=1 Tax=Halobaculum marinum TaxID=3031996 RepID=UPI0023E3D965|nr:hypothetical protein [Halobaculum sp. DT55]
MNTVMKKLRMANTSSTIDATMLLAKAPKESKNPMSLCGDADHGYQLGSRDESVERSRP